MAAPHLLMMSPAITVISIVEDRIPKEVVEKIRNVTRCLQVTLLISLVIIFISLKLIGYIILLVYILYFNYNFSNNNNININKYTYNIDNTDNIDNIDNTDNIDNR